MKKILSLILAGLMTLSCAAYVAADDAAVDASASDAEAFAIEFLADLGIYHGKSSDEFVAAAADPIERYQMALFVARVSTGWVDDYQWDYDYTWEDGTANNTLFNDLEGTAAADYLGAISYANQKGIIEGYSATKFGPTDGITYRDALTMVVRTLGYTGLAYPWGYIQQAVELGLTEGVDAAYTENLNRGQVAVILYNAMFATTKAGTTLAKQVFDVDFGWRNIILVATDEGAYTAADYASYRRAGLVAFKIVNDNGTLQDKAYWVKPSDLGLTGHEEELELGSVYAALFTIENDLATIKASASLNYKTVENIGITDNEGVAFATMPVADALAKYTLVKNLDPTYVSDFVEKLIVVTDADDIIYVDKLDNVGIDVATNNIVKWDGEKWVTEWVYNVVLDRYYQYITKDGATYINWMSDTEFAKWYQAAIKVATDTIEGYELSLNKTTLLDQSAYAKLRLYDLDADAEPEYAIYKKYAIGMFVNTTMKCTNEKCNADKAAYQITTLEDANVYKQFAEGSHDEAHMAGEYAWINVDTTKVTGFKNADGSYNNGVVLYNINATTGEIEIVKYITRTAADDKDSYIVDGILQQYSTASGILTISGKQYPMDYATLLGATLKLGDKTIPEKYVVAKELDNYLMQYVTAVICDGKVVDVDLRGDDAQDVIVVVAYAGITSDGYIAVYGYKTDNPILSLFKINSYNGWKRGDYKYNAALAGVDAAFEYGSIYTIKSYDAETKSYGVYTQNIEDALDRATAPLDIVYDTGYRVYQNAVEATGGDTYIVLTPSGNIYVKTGVKDNVYGVQVLYKSGNKFVVYLDDRDGQNLDLNAHLFYDRLDIGYVLYDKDTAVVLDAAYDDTQPLNNTIDEINDFYLLGATTSTLRVTNLMNGNVDYVFTTRNVDLMDGCIYRTIGVDDKGYHSIIVGKVKMHDDGKDEWRNFKRDVTWEYDYDNSARYAYAWDFSITKDDTLALGAPHIYKGVLNQILAEQLGLIDSVDTYANATIYKNLADAKVPSDNIKVYTLTLSDGKVHVDLTSLTELAEKTYYFVDFVIYDKLAKTTVVYIIDYATIEYDVPLNVGEVVAKTWYYLEDEEKIKEIEFKVTPEVVGTVAKVKGIDKPFLLSAELKSVTYKFDDVLSQYHDPAIDADMPHGDLDLGQEGILFGYLDEHAPSYFFYNDSLTTLTNVVTDVYGNVVVDGEEDLYSASCMTFEAYECCKMVHTVKVDLNKKINFIATDSETTIETTINGGEVTVEVTSTLTYDFETDTWEFVSAEDDFSITYAD